MSTANLNQDTKIALRLVLIVMIMLGAAFAAVPFYDWFCRQTGFGGTTQFAEEESAIVLDEEMLVRFSANRSAGMPWEFRPLTHKMKVKIGETNLVFFEAYNPTDDVITGTASYNIAPLELGSYFQKIECFCFVEQTLQPGERVEMPVTFYVDPEIAEDRDVEDIHSMTLSYTFHLTSRGPQGNTDETSEESPINQ